MDQQLIRDAFAILTPEQRAMLVAKVGRELPASDALRRTIEDAQATARAVDDAKAKTE